MSIREWRGSVHLQRQPVALTQVRWRGKVHTIAENRSKYLSLLDRRKRRTAWKSTKRNQHNHICERRRDWHCCTHPRRANVRGVMNGRCRQTLCPPIDWLVSKARRLSCRSLTCCGCNVLDTTSHCSQNDYEQ